MANDIRWSPVSVNFGDASAFMNNATNSISKAGTIFGELRKSILDEEQRAIENAYKEKVFNENVRQFDTRLGWDQDKFAKEQAWNREQLAKQQELGYAQLAELAKYHQGSLANQAAGNRLQAERFYWEKGKDEKQQQAYAKAMQDFQDAQDTLSNYATQRGVDLAQPLALHRQTEAQITDLEDQVENAPNAEVLQNRMEMLQNLYATRDAAAGVIKAYDANHTPKIKVPLGQSPYTQDLYFRRLVGSYGGDARADTPFTGLAATQAAMIKDQSKAMQEYNRALAVAKENSRGRAVAAGISAKGHETSLSSAKGINPADQQQILNFKELHNTYASNFGVKQWTDADAVRNYRRIVSLSKTPFIGDDLSSAIIGTKYDFGTLLQHPELLNAGSPEALELINILKNEHLAQKSK